MRFLRTNRLIVAGFAVVLAVLTANAVSSYWNTARAIEDEQQVSTPTKVGSGVDKGGWPRRRRDRQRGYLLTGDEEFLKPFHEANTRVQSELRQMEAVTEPDTALQPQVQRLRNQVTERLVGLQETVRTRQAGAPVPLAVLARGKQSMDAVRDTAKGIVDAERRLLQDRQERAASARRRSFWAFVVATALALVTVGGGYALLQRDANARRKHATPWPSWRPTTAASSSPPGRASTASTPAATAPFSTGPGTLLGYEPQAVLGKNMHSLSHHTREDGSPYPEEDCPIYKVLRTGQGGRVDDEYFYRTDGSRFPVEYTSYPIVKDGELTGAVVTFTEITDRKKYQDDLLAAEQAAEDANQAKSTFLANMSHELRPPLNAVIMYSELLQEEAQDRGGTDSAPTWTASGRPASPCWPWSTASSICPRSRPARWSSNWRTSTCRRPSPRW